MREVHEAGGALPGGSDWSLAAVQKLLLGRRWLILAIAAEVFVIVGLVTFLKTPLYESSARLVIERSAPKVVQGDDVVPTVWNEFEIQRFYQTQYILLRDVALLRKALDRGDVRAALSRSLAPRAGAAEGDAPGPDDAQLAAYIAASLKVENVEYSNLVRVAFRHPDPQVAADVVNAVVDEYREYFIESGIRAREDASQFLKKKVEEASAEVMGLDGQLAEERRKFTAFLPSGAAEMGQERLQSVDAELTAAKARLAKSEARLNSYQSAPASGIEEVRSNPQVLRYRETLGELEKEAAQLEGRVGPGWPRLRELRVAMDETRAILQQEEERLRGQAVQLAAAQADQDRKTVARLSELLERELGRTAESQGNSTQYEKLRQAYQQKREALNSLLARGEEVALGAAMRDVVERQVMIVDRAVPAERPAVPRTKLNLALGLAFGLFLGVAAAFLAEALDNKVRGGVQLTEISKVPLLGSIPRLEGPAKPRLIFSRKKGAVAPMIAARNHDVEEAFRALRSALLLSQPGRPPRLLLVTSALPGEGKSTVAANLGRTLASFGHRTVLVDCDLRHPRLHRVFHAKPTRGVTNVLATSMPLDEVLVQTQYENLWFIPGGPCPPDPATLLDTQHVRSICADLSARGFEFIIIDTPPLLVFADTLSLVPAVEGVILVARANQTPKEALRQTAESLRKIKAPVLGAVLNGEVAEEHGSSYYRYYHYRRGYYRKGAEDRAGTPAVPSVSSVSSVPSVSSVSFVTMDGTDDVTDAFTGAVVGAVGGALGGTLVGTPVGDDTVDAAERRATAAPAAQKTL